MAKPKIGAHYRPTWFRVTKSDGAYAALNAPMSQDEIRIQSGLLNAKRARRASAGTGFLLYFGTLLAGILGYVFCVA